MTDEKLYPREFREYADNDQDAHDGYLIVGENIWNRLRRPEYLPDAWVKVRAGGPRPAEKRPGIFPETNIFSSIRLKLFSRQNLKSSLARFMKAPLLFDPTSGTFFDLKTNEGTKLTKLGSEGRENLTMITTFSILNRLNEAAST